MTSLMVFLVSLGAFAMAPEAEIKTAQTEQAVTVKVTPPPGTHLNFDGPWKLEIKGTLPLSNSSGVFGIDAFDKTKQAFTVALARKASASERGEYSLVYFFCASDNSWCRRAQAKGVL